MPEVDDGQLEEVLADVLEEVSFAFSEPAPPGTRFQGDLLVAKLTYGPEHKGQMVHAMTKEYGEEIAASMLCLEPDDPLLEQQAFDAVGEILNIVIGAWIPHIYGSSDLIPIGTPVVQTMTPDEYEAEFGNMEHRIVLLLDEMHRVDLATTLGKAP